MSDELNAGDAATTPKLSIYNRCGAPAPLVVNGAIFTGCQLEAGHEGRHEVKIKWMNSGATP